MLLLTSIIREEVEFACFIDSMTRSSCNILWAAIITNAIAYDSGSRLIISVDMGEQPTSTITVVVQCYRPKIVT